MITIVSKKVIQLTENRARMSQTHLPLYDDSGKLATSFKTVRLIYANSLGEIRNLFSPIKMNLSAVFG